MAATGVSSPLGLSLPSLGMLLVLAGLPTLGQMPILFHHPCAYHPVICPHPCLQSNECARGHGPANWQYPDVISRRPRPIALWQKSTSLLMVTMLRWVCIYGREERDITASLEVPGAWQWPRWNGDVVYEGVLYLVLAP
ncbi:hypothetical protein JB92DRAFT_837406 [Gautieria morchelliformis]|nr:hypothetical protein JB92DRAFT_837406 [Gautieria morchelliformis]